MCLGLLAQGLFFDGTKGAALWENYLFISLFVLQKFGACYVDVLALAGCKRLGACIRAVTDTSPLSPTRSGSVLLRHRHRRNREDGPTAAVSEGAVGGAVPSALVVDSCGR